MNISLQRLTGTRYFPETFVHPRQTGRVDFVKPNGKP